MIWVLIALAVLLWAGATIGREVKRQLDQRDFEAEVADEFPDEDDFP